MITLTNTQLSQLLGVTKRTVQRRAIKNDWPYEIEKGLGGSKRVYCYTKLPLEDKRHIYQSIFFRYQQIMALLDEEQDASRAKPYPYQLISEIFSVPYDLHTEDFISQHLFAHEMDEVLLTKTFVRLGLLSLAELYVNHNRIRKIAGYDVFCKEYNRHELALHPNVYRVMPKVSRVSLLRWQKGNIFGKKIPILPHNEEIDVSVKDLCDKYITQKSRIL